MDRFNPEGIPRNRFIHALETPSIVQAAIKRNSCLLCRRSGVNSAGICEICTAQLSGKENDLVQKWLRGAMP